MFMVGVFRRTKYAYLTNQCRIYRVNYKNLYVYFMNLLLGYVRKEKRDPRGKGPLVG